MGTLVIPIGIPINVVITIPINRAPLIFLANKIPVINIPIIANSASPLVIFPKATIVPPSLGWITTRALSNPIKDINNPIPTDMDFLYYLVLNLL